MLCFRTVFHLGPALDGAMVGSAQPPDLQRLGVVIVMFLDICRLTHLAWLRNKVPAALVYVGVCSRICPLPLRRSHLVMALSGVAR